MKKCYLSGTSEHIPLFSEVLDYIKGRVPLLIEVKLPTKDTQICARLMEEHLFHAPVAVWTLRTGEALTEARSRYDMYIFERIHELG